MRRLIGGASLAVCVVGACAGPTEIEVSVTTDIDCARVTGVLVAVGTLGQLESKPASSTATSCIDGTIGALVVVPSGDRGAEVGIRVVMGLDGRSAEQCVDDGYQGSCVVARRAIRFIGHSKLRLPVRMEAACIDVPCDANSTCAASNCVAPSSCDGSTCTPPPPSHWSALPSAPEARDDPFYAWSGRALFVWGGGTNVGRSNTGFSFDPAANAWTPFGAPSATFPGRVSGVGVWSGQAFLIWGGIDGSTGFGDGARFDGSSWSPTSDPTQFPKLSAFAGRSSFAAVWADSVNKLLVWGGDNPARGQLSDGAAYDPVFDTWTPIAQSPLSVRSSPAAVWVGGRMVVYGGFCSGNGCDDAASYDPATDRWSAALHVTALGSRVPHLAVSDGQRAYFWGGSGCPTCDDDSTLVIIDPSATQLEIDSSSADPTPRRGAAGWWASGRLWMWGGARYSTPPSMTALGDGASFDPQTRTWTPMPSEGAPPARYDHAIVWTGREALVYGGVGTAGAQLADAARFGP